MLKSKKNNLPEKDGSKRSVKEYAEDDEEYGSREIVCNAQDYWCECHTRAGDQTGQ